MGLFDLLDDDEDDFGFSTARRSAQKRRRDAEAHAKQVMREAEERLQRAEENLNRRMGDLGLSHRYSYKDDPRIKREERVKVKGIPVKNLEKHVDYVKLKEEQLRRSLLEQVANEVKAVDPEPRGVSLSEGELNAPSPRELLAEAQQEIVVHDLSDTDRKLLARIVQSSLNMTDVFFDVSREDRQVLLEKLGGSP